MQRATMQMGAAIIIAEFQTLLKLFLPKKGGTGNDSKEFLMRNPP